MDETYEIVNKVKGKTATLIISGYISPWNSNAGANIQREFRALEAKYDHIHIDLINCFGGSIWEGWPTYNVIHNSKKKVTVHAEGLVASMGSILFVSVPLKNRTVAKGSRVMTHKASGGAMGDYEKLAEMSELMKGMEDELIQAIAEQTGNTEEYVRNNWFKRGVDKYFKPDEAVQAKLAAKVIDASKVKNELPEDVANSADLEQIAGFYQNQINNVNTDNSNSEMENKPLFIAALKSAGIDVSNEASEAQLLEHVQALAEKNKTLTQTNSELDNKVKTLEKEAETKQEAVVKNMLDESEKAGKTTSDQRENLESFANANFEGFCNYLASLEGRKSFTNEKKDKKKGEESDESRDEWPLDKWRKEDPKGLAEMKANDPDRFDELVKAAKK